jgi:hypothetical protein
MLCFFSVVLVYYRQASQECQVLPPFVWKMRLADQRFSLWTSIQRAYYNNFMTAFRLLKPFLLKMEVTTGEEFEEVYSDAMIELMLEDFSGIWFYLTVWGLKKHET